jgi:hypothetical protein
MDVNSACYNEELRQSTNFRNKVLRAADGSAKEDQTINKDVSQLLQIFLTMCKNKKLQRTTVGKQPNS